MRVNLLLAGFMLLTTAVVSGQGLKNCGTFAGQSELRKAGMLTETDRQFEDWLKTMEARRSQLVVSGTLRLPVVVHIIHNDEPVGTGTNLSQAQIDSQIKALNDDFAGLNADLTNVPNLFRDIAGTMPVIFELATADPDGNPSSGIIRVRGPRTGYLRAELPQIKALSYWPAEQYINIWVCNMTDYLGYTQFPVSTLPGIENVVQTRLTDGIVVNYRAFGSSTYGNFSLLTAQNKGRILTHEMGHYFGLRHIWGDLADCKGNDYVDDTPQQSSETTGCPSGQIQDCGGIRMHQNYMDYTYDACMGMFTRKQTERMYIVLTNSPRRVTLIPQLKQLQTGFPVIFSPNGDGINDYWIWPDTDAYAGCLLIIYDRTGREVYRASGYDNTWSGRGKNGAQLEEEAYYYELRCDGLKTITGGVRLIR